MNVLNMTSSFIAKSSFDREKELNRFDWEALLQARQSLKQKRRYRLWHRLNKLDK